MSLKTSRGPFPYTRMRRNRSEEFSRRLNSENQLNVSDLILPVFVIEGNNESQAVESMPGVNRLSIDLLVKHTELVFKLGIPAVALFPVVGNKKISASRGSLQS